MHYQLYLSIVWRVTLYLSTLQSLFYAAIPSCSLRLLDSSEMQSVEFRRQAKTNEVLTKSSICTICRAKEDVFLLYGQIVEYFYISKRRARRLLIVWGLKMVPWLEYVSFMSLELI